MIELKTLQRVRLKGRVSLDDLVAGVDEDKAAIAETVTRLIDADLLIDGKTLRLSQSGRVRLDALLAAERRSADADAIAAAYRQFRSVNSDFKALVSEWQLRDGQPNLHDDDDYDAAVLVRLGDVHQRVAPIIAAAAQQIPRLWAYRRKLDAAYTKVRSGDRAWLTRPLIDSYHTVWFELHEELIGAAGLTREEEAEAGHGG